MNSPNVSYKWEYSFKAVYLLIIALLIFILPVLYVIIFLPKGSDTSGYILFGVLSFIFFIMSIIYGIIGFIIGSIKDRRNKILESSENIR